MTGALVQPRSWAVPGFIHELRVDDLPGAVIEQAQRCVLDLIGVAASGSGTDMSRLARNHAARHFVGTDRAARMLFDGRAESPVGAALSGGMTIDSMDAHDGHALAKGHAGAAVLPALLALIDGNAGADADGPGLLTALVIGYELGIRAGIALHAQAADYHCSGAWNALACAGVASRLLRLDSGTTEYALGTAEYHAPRGAMMGCIDNPTMVKDGSGWGAMSGVSAALLAADGFTGSPAPLVHGEHAGLWDDLGVRWRILELYFKPHPVCRWAQPAVQAALVLRAQHGFTAADIDHAEIITFHHAVRLHTRRPASTEQAQYSLPFPVAAGLVRGVVRPAEVGPGGIAERGGPAVERGHDDQRERGLQRALSCATLGAGERRTARRPPAQLGTDHRHRRPRNAAVRCRSGCQVPRPSRRPAGDAACWRHS